MGASGVTAQEAFLFHRRNHSFVPTALCIPKHLTHHLPTSACCDSQCCRVHTDTRIQSEGTHTDSITNTKNIYSSWQQSYFLWSGDLWLHFLFPPQHQTSRKPTLSWQQHRAKVFRVFFCGDKLVAGQRICTSLAAQGKVNSSGGHSLICQGWHVEEGPSCLPVTSHNLWYQRQLEREGVKTVQPCCSLASYLSLPIASSFQHNICNSVDLC